jgi:hypothetical protein
MGNQIRPPSGTCIPRPNKFLLQKLLDKGFNFPELVVPTSVSEPTPESKQENDVVIPVSNGDHNSSSSTPSKDYGMVSCTMPPNYGLFTQRDRGDIKYLYLCDKDGKSIAYISWWNKHDCIKASICDNDQEVNVKGFELVDNEFKRIETNYVKYIKLLNFYYKKRYQCASQVFLDTIYENVKEIEKKIPLNQREEYNKLNARNISNRNEEYSYKYDESYEGPFKFKNLETI